jgi:hypothetical protein
MQNSGKEDSNGWASYKIAVLKQLEFVTSQIEVVRALVTKVDKEITTLTTREKSEADLLAINIKLEKLFEYKAMAEGKSSRSNTISIVAVVVSILTVIFHAIFSYK